MPGQIRIRRIYHHPAASRSTIRPFELAYVRAPAAPLRVVALGALLAACGGLSARNERDAQDSGAGTGVALCEDFSPCGGDVVGSWRVTGACLPALTLRPLDCAADTYRLFEQAGVLELAASGSWSFSNEFRMSYTRELDDSCLGDRTCEEFADLAEAGSGGYQSFSASCTPSAAGCHCEVSLAGTTESRGTYLVSSSTLSFVEEPEGAGFGEWRYCARGSSLAFRTTYDTGGTLERF